jgi:hypothetical protein
VRGRCEAGLVKDIKAGLLLLLAPANLKARYAVNSPPSLTSQLSRVLVSWTSVEDLSPDPVGTRSQALVFAIEGNDTPATLPGFGCLYRSGAFYDLCVRPVRCSTKEYVTNVHRIKMSFAVIICCIVRAEVWNSRHFSQPEFC